MATLPDYLKQLTHALEKAGATRRAIDSFRLHWHSLPGDARELPCPFCYSEGVPTGKLVDVHGENEIKAVRCVTCARIVIVRDRA